MRYLPKGSYYLRARFRGNPVRESLKTTNYRVACMRLNERLRILRQLAGAAADGPQTLAEAIGLLRAEIADNPRIKASSRRLYLKELEALQPGGTATPPATPLLHLTDAEMSRWWAATAARYAPQQANHLLMFVRRALKIARKAGAIVGDPLEHIRPMKVPRTRLRLLTADQFSRVVASIREQGGATSADFVEFMAYSGLRPAEVPAVLWEHIDEAGGFLHVYGGSEGTKNREPRRVSLVPAMRLLLARLPGPRTGRVFSIMSPAAALANACKRLGYPHQRLYDLRHTFATACCASGVDVPTIALWLGHKDGGALAMRTYIHPSDEHGQRSAAKVTFGT